MTLWVSDCIWMRPAGQNAPEAVNSPSVTKGESVYQSHPHPSTVSSNGGAAVRAAEAATAPVATEMATIPATRAMNDRCMGPAPFLVDCALDRGRRALGGAKDPLNAA